MAINKRYYIHTSRERRIARDWIVQAKRHIMGSNRMGVGYDFALIILDRARDDLSPARWWMNDGPGHKGQGSGM